MTTGRHLERDLPQILGDLAMTSYPDYIDDVLADTAQRRQRPAWTFPERWLPMDIATSRVPAARFPLRAVGVLLLIGLLIASAVAVYIGSRSGLPAPFGLAANGGIVVSNDGDIHMVDPLTGALTAIVTGPDRDSGAAVSPDGTRIAFQRELVLDGRTGYDLVTTRVDGSDPIILTPEPRTGGFAAYAWSPDGKTLLADHAADEDLWLYDASRQAAPTLVASDAETYLAPFRPTAGSSILIRRDTGVPRLLRLDLQTGQETTLVEAHTREDLGSARWSPDGSAVVYNGSPVGDFSSQRLFLVDADGMTTRQITNAPGVWFDIDATWSPGGDKVGFLRYERVEQEWLVRPLAIYDLATDTVREVGPLSREVRAARPSSGDGDASSGEGYIFEWSPDGRSIIAIPGEGAAHPVIIDVATGEWRLLDPIVSPDGVSAAWQRKAPGD